jgi:hypothetical protein
VVAHSGEDQADRQVAFQQVYFVPAGEKSRTIEAAVAPEQGIWRQRAGGIPPARPFGTRGVKTKPPKVEWHPDELYPRVGFLVTNMSRPAERLVMFYNHRGTAEQHIKEGKSAVAWTRLSCHSFRANAVRLQLHALAYNLANFLRTLALPDEVEQWSMTTLRDRLVKIGAKIVRHNRSITFQMAEVTVPRGLFEKILSTIAALRPLPSARC